MLTGVFLAQAQDSKLAGAVRFAAKVLTGFPSILAGVFAYGAVVLATGGFSALAGAVALSILMLPTIILTSEERHRDGAREDEGRGHRHGRDRHADRLDGVAADRDAGNPDRRDARGGARGRRNRAAALHRAVQQLLDAGRGGQVDLMQPTASLAVLIYNFSGMPFDNQVELAWAAALVLVLIVLVINLIGQSFSSSDRSSNRRCHKNGYRSLSV